MSFASYLTRVFGKRPTWLYRFEIPGGATYHLTSRGRNYVTGADRPDDDYPTGQTFTKAALYNKGITRTTNSQRAEMEVVLPTAHALAQAILGYSGAADIKVTIWKLYAGDPDEECVVKFAGRVVKVQMSFLIITLWCEESFTAMRRSSVAQVMQRLCRHAHYFTNDDGGGCTLDLADFQQTMSITVVDGRNLTIPLAALQPDGTFTAGILDWGGEERFIESHLGDQIILESIMPGLEAAVGIVDEDALVAPGCNLIPDTCLATFDNIANFGGFWWMEETPFDGRSIA